MLYILDQKRLHEISDIARRVGRPLMLFLSAGWLTGASTSPAFCATADSGRSEETEAFRPRTGTFQLLGSSVADQADSENFHLQRAWVTNGFDTIEIAAKEFPALGAIPDR